MITGVIIETDIIGSDLLKNSDPETQSNMPDVPYEPDLDIEIDFPRGTQNAILFFKCELQLWNLVIINYLMFVFLPLLFIFFIFFNPNKTQQLILEMRRRIESKRLKEHFLAPKKTLPQSNSL